MTSSVISNQKMVISHFKVVDQPDESLSTALPIGLEGTLTSPIITLVGPNGSGKTAFLRMIMSSYYHYVNNVRIPTQVKKFAEEELTQVKRVIDYFNRNGTVNESIWKVQPFDAEDGLSDLESISRFLMGEYPGYFSSKEDKLQRKRDLKEILRTHVIMTKEAEQKLNDFGEKGHRFCSYGKTIKRKPIHNNCYFPGRSLWGLNISEIKTLQEELRAKRIPTDTSRFWKYIQIECHDSVNDLYMLGFSIKRHPFDRLFRGDATALAHELEYYTFEDQLASWQGKTKSSGQSTLAEVETVEKLIYNFFQEGIYKRPIPSKDPLDKYLIKEDRQISPEQRANATLIVLMDEPTTSLDYKASKHFARTLQEMTHEYAGRLQFFVATHDPAIIELSGTQCMNFYETPVCVQSYPPSFDDPSFI